MKNIYEVLRGLEIEFEEFQHPAFFTCEDADGFAKSHPGGHFKTLLLRNREGDKYYLVILEGYKRLDIKALSKTLNENKLSFASPERLKEILNLTPGSVSPFGLIHDEKRQAKIIVDADLWKHEFVFFHPNINTATLKIKSSDLAKFFESLGYVYSSLAL